MQISFRFFKLQFLISSSSSDRDESRLDVDSSSMKVTCLRDEILRLEREIEWGNLRVQPAKGIFNSIIIRAWHLNTQEGNSDSIPVSKRNKESSCKSHLRAPAIKLLIQDASYKTLHERVNALKEETT